MMVDAYHDAGYDCIALTEHCCYLNDLEVEKRAKAYAEEKYGTDFIVIVGEELNFTIGKNQRLYGMDMIGLFLEEYIYCGYRSGDILDLAKFISARSALDEVHAQGGLGIIAHDNLTASFFHAMDYGAGEGLWTWDHRRDLPIDGWEIGNSHTLSLMLSHPQESVAEGYITMANSDAHNVAEIMPRGICSTSLFVTAKTPECIKESLLKKRTVADCNGQLYGEQRWIDLFLAYQKLGNRGPGNGR